MHDWQEKKKINWKNKYCEEEGDTAQRKTTVIEKGSGSAEVCWYVQK